MEWVAENIARVRDRIHAACQRARREPQTVTVVAVTKGVAPDLVRAAWDAGLRHFGENRMQEAQPKLVQLANLTATTWHLVGHLQTNKAKPAAACFQVVHSVDSLRIAEALHARAEPLHKRLAVFLQVNISGETTKHGMPPQDVEPLARRLQALASLEWRGVMTIAPEADDPETARPVFRRLRELRDHWQRALGAEPLQLSMGMSHDFSVAVEEGADVVRIGSAIFQEHFWDEQP